MGRLRHHILRLAGLLRTDLRVGTAAGLRALAAPHGLVFNLQPGRPTGRASDRPARRPEITGIGLRGLGRALFLTTLLLSSLCSGGEFATAHAVTIPNTAHLTFAIGGVAQPPTASNTVALVVRSPAQIRFLKYVPNTGSSSVPVHVAPTSFVDGGGIHLIPPPPPALDPTVPLTGAGNGGPVNYYLGETIYIQLSDPDQDITPTPDTVIVTITCTETGDVETLQLTETAPGSGIFAGYLPTATDATALGANGSAARQG